MRTNKLFSLVSLGSLLIATALQSQAQTTATWIGPASGGEWNTAAAWDTALPPGLDGNGTTNAFIGTGTNVSYNLPMTAASFGALTLNGIVNVNTNGFNNSGVTMSRPGGGNRLFVNPGGEVNVTGTLGISSNAWLVVTNGGSVAVSGTLQFGLANTAGSSGFMTNFGGTINATNTIINNNNASASSLFVINGGINNLGNVTINRAGPSSQPALGVEGLVVNNGQVNMTSLAVGGTPANSFLTMWVTGGVITNTGATSVHLTSTTGRPARYVQSGGLFVNPDPNVVTLNPQGAATVITAYAVTGGTNIVGGFQFGDTGGANVGTVNFTNAATIYVGSMGLAWSGVVTLNAILNSGGLFGATADWTGTAPMRLNSGAYTFQAGDADGTPHNILLSAALSGSGGLTKTGNGTLTLNAPNTYLGPTVINNSTLAIGAAGSLTSTLIVTRPGTTFDVSALGGAFTPVTGQTLSGFGAVAGLATTTGGTIQPGSNNVTGTLTFSNGLSETGNTLNRFILSSDPVNGSNDLVSVIGDLTVSGANTVTVVGTLPNGTNYTLMKYTGNFTGDVSNFTLTGVTGYLTNIVAAKTIALHTLATARGPANVVWVGNPVNNFWDTAVTTNWLNAGALDYFITGDTVQFNAVGAAITNVNLVGSVAPASTTVDATTNYYFTGNGSLDGAGGLTKTNSGTLTVLTTNNYSGVTTINGGVLEVNQLASGLSPSGIGAASSDSANLVISNGTFRYSGPGVTTDHGATLASAASTIDVSANGNLTITGSLIGNGGLTKVGNGTLILSSGNSYTGSTVLSNGTVQINSTASALVNTPVAFDGGTLSLNVSGQQIYGNQFNVNTMGTLISAGGNNNVVQGEWSGSGTLNLNLASGTFTVNHDLTTNFTGTILVSDSSTATFRFNSGGNSSGAQQCSGSATATFDLGNSTVALLNRNGGGTSFGNYDLGAFSGGTGTFLRGSANASSGSTYSIGAKNLNTIYAGTIANGAGGSAATTGITKVGTGTLTLSGQNTYTGNTTISNGVLALAFNPTNGTDGSIGSSAQISILPGTFLDVSARSDGTFPLTSGQLLRGRGTLNGILDTTSGGMVAPGGGTGGNTGTLYVTNNINLGGFTWMKLNKANSTNSDRLVSTLGNITYGGTLVITNIGPGMQTGDTFTLFSGGGLSGGTFGQIVAPNYYTLDTTQLGVNGTVSIASVLPPPAITNVDFSSLSSGTITLYTSGGAPDGPVVVWATTNLTPPLAGWTPIATNNFDGGGNLNLPITVDPAAPQNYYILQGF